ncbi:hypothetical protein ACA910_012773 [Epithemia clementina (nom. ined.)]
MQPSPMQRTSETGSAGGNVAAAGDGPSASTSHDKNSSDGNPSSNTQDNNPTSNQKKYESEAQLVLDFLKHKGMHDAAAELMKKIEAESKNDSERKDSETQKSARERFLEEDEKLRAQRTLLTKTTGGGYGYDRDAAWPVVQWGIPDTEAAAVAEANASRKSRHLGVEEARGMLDAFIHFQLWVLNLPDHPSSASSSSSTSDHYENVVLQSAKDNPILRAQQAILENHDQPVSAIVKTMVTTHQPSSVGGVSGDMGLYNLPPSVKPELLAVSFALLVHTYADLLEVGMESTAQSLRDAFAPVYQALFPEEFKDLVQCASTESMMRLNAHNSQHIEAVGQLKSILVQIATYQLRKDEYIAHMQSSLGNSAATPQQLQEKLAADPKVKDCDKKIHILQSKYKDLSRRATQWFDKMHDLPFLRRARATRWILTISTSTYAMLAAFLGSRDDSLLTMSTMLQTKCTLQVENRDPLPYTPACLTLEGEGEGRSELAINRDGNLNWAVPAPRPETNRADEELPFPKYHLEDEYENEEDAARDQAAVCFNRALLVNGFRRLEALERKREYEVLTPLAQKRARQGEIRSRFQANPLEPSILLSTLSASSSLGPLTGKGKRGGDSLTGRFSAGGISATWEEPGIGICCANICSLGRRVASGCDDAAVRIYKLDNDKGGGEPCEVLVGHKNGLPVFDVDWNRDGRALLSAGGDGSIRLWDTMATGPFGKTTTPKAKSSTSSEKRAGKKQQQKAEAKETNMNVPGWREGEPVAYTSGAALAVYRGHAPNSPVWSVSFAPCGYYFCSTGADATARLWTTDRPVPVRMFSGHVSANVNCVKWHPNANYVVTGSDDKTARLWDIQTGRTVRILTGASAGINTLQISPGGRYCAGADYSGLVHLWDLGSGKKMSVFRSFLGSSSTREQNVLHSISFSACGQALAVGGDDCCVRIWDIRTAGITENEQVRSPFKSFPTRRTVVMDLQYTKRNLLLAVGKYVSHVPIAE